MHSDLIPNKKIMAVPEPEEEHDGGPPLYLRPHEIIHDEVPALRYLVCLRIIEFQDWHTPPPSSDKEMGARDSDDSGDSNYNGYHPGFATGGGGARLRTTGLVVHRSPGWVSVLAQPSAPANGDRLSSWAM